MAARRRRTSSGRAFRPRARTGSAPAAPWCRCRRRAARRARRRASPSATPIHCHHAKRSPSRNTPSAAVRIGWNACTSAVGVAADADQRLVGGREREAVHQRAADQEMRPALARRSPRAPQHDHHQHRRGRRDREADRHERIGADVGKADFGGRHRTTPRGSRTRRAGRRGARDLGVGGVRRRHSGFGPVAPFGCSQGPLRAAHSSRKGAPRRPIFNPLLTMFSQAHAKGRRARFP